MANGLLLSRFFLITWLFRLLMLLDNLLLNLCRASYKVFVYTSRITLINGEQIELFTNRVYLILGIALVFIIAYNLLTYIVDPDKISDKKSGAGAFVKNVIISLTIIVITPMAFVKLYSFQNTIITQGIIANIIMGVPSNDSGTEDDQSDLSENKKAEEFLERGAKNVTATVYSSFILPTTDNFNALDCPSESNVGAESLSDANYAYCEAYADMQETGSNSKFRTLIDDYEDEFDYYFLVSTAGVLVMLFFFASYCIELGKRAGKLAILQLLAPIPLAMEIVPGKSGSRQKWLNEVVSTYLDVFMYQATVFIVIYLLQFVGPTVENLFSTAYSGTTSVGTTIERTFALVFLMFGLFKFGKDVPKMIEDLIGIKGAGSFGDVAKRAFAMAGVSGGLLGATVGRFARNFNDTGGDGIKGFLKKTGSGLAGAGSGIVRTLWGAKDVHSFKDAGKFRKRVNEQLVTKKVQRNAYYQAHKDEKLGTFGAHARDFAHAYSEKASGYLGATPRVHIPGTNLGQFARDEDSYREKLNREKVHERIKAKYDETIKSKYKSDSQWSIYNSMLDHLKASGMTVYHDDKTGHDWTEKELNTALYTREYAIMDKNKAYFQKAWGDIQSIVDANQGVKGVTSNHRDLSAFDARMHEDMLRDIVGIQWNDTDYKYDTVGGFSKELKTLGDDTPFQDRKQTEERAKTAKEEAQKTAKEKTADKK